MGKIVVSEREMAEKSHSAVNLMSFIDIMATSPEISRFEMFQALRNTCDLIIKNEYNEN